MDTKFKGKSFALLADLRSPYVYLGDHPEWRPQFVRAINSSKVHKTLEEKLAPLGPFLLCYTKIVPDKEALLAQAGLPEESTVCVVSSVGEHAITPWMIIHNIAHTYLTWHISAKRDIIKLLGLDPVHFSIKDRQAHYVHCQAARKGLIPNINEMIYELFTTWVWSGSTRSGEPALAAYCDELFPRVVAKYRGKMFWHRFRQPSTAVLEPVPGLAAVLDPSAAQPVATLHSPSSVSRLLSVPTLS